MKRYDADKFTPPFRVGRKQGKAILDSKGLEVVFFKDSEIQAQMYCDYLNEDEPIDELLEWLSEFDNLSFKPTYKNVIEKIWQLNQKT